MHYNILTYIKTLLKLIHVAKFFSKKNRRLAKNNRQFKELDESIGNNFYSFKLKLAKLLPLNSVHDSALNFKQLSIHIGESIITRIHLSE